VEALAFYGEPTGTRDTTTRSVGSSPVPCRIAGREGRPTGRTVSSGRVSPHRRTARRAICAQILHEGSCWQACKGHRWTLDGHSASCISITAVAPATMMVGPADEILPAPSSEPSIGPYLALHTPQRHRCADVTRADEDTRCNLHPQMLDARSSQRARGWSLCRCSRCCPTPRPVLRSL
jgi:hypothetical protein